VKVRCDAVAIALPPAPLHDLATSSGAQASYDPVLGGFPVAVDARGCTGPSWLFAAGTVCGQGGSQARASGARAGKAAGSEAAALTAAEAAGAAPVLA
jgi:succinate dehydrogenase/fumarate reductase flavoprotein subunit